MLGTTSFPSINSLNIIQFSVFKLLDKIGVRKASGPDCIPSRILQNLARELAPVLHYQNDLKKDLNLLESWGTTYGMRFNAAKCNFMRVSRKQIPIP